MTTATLRISNPEWEHFRILGSYLTKHFPGGGVQTLTLDHPTGWLSYAAVVDHLRAEVESGDWGIPLPTDGDLAQLFADLGGETTSVTVKGPDGYLSLNMERRKRGIVGVWCREGGRAGHCVRVDGDFGDLEGRRIAVARRDGTWQTLRVGECVRRNDLILPGRREPTDDNLCTCITNPDKWAVYEAYQVQRSVA